jgi:nucleoside-diphosphate-sugar epimerase
VKLYGNGLIASALSEFNLDGFHFYASGVSDSSETRASEFNRERLLLSKALVETAGDSLVYFSTCSIWDSSKSQTPYVQHKLAMEDLVSKSHSGRVVRLPSVVGIAGNSSNLINSLYNQIADGHAVTVEKGARRFLLDSADMARVLDFHLRSGSPAEKMFVIAPRYSITVAEIVEIIKDRLDTSSEVREVQGNSHLRIPQDMIGASILSGEKSGVDLGSKDYPVEVLDRYITRRLSQNDSSPSGR